IAMDDAAVVEVAEAFADFAEEEGGLLRAEARRDFVHQLAERRAGDIFHDDDRLAIDAIADIEDVDEVRALEIHALADAAQLDLLVGEDDLEGDLAAAVADRVIDFAETAPAGSALNGVPFERTIAVLVSVAP